MRYHVVLHLLGLILEDMADFTDRTTHEFYDEMMVSAFAVYRLCDNKDDAVKKLIVDIMQIHDDHKHKDLCLFDLKL